jgi:uncharacterized oxidoreductase
MFTQFFKIFTCAGAVTIIAGAAVLIAGDKGTTAKPLKVKGVVMNNPHNTILITGGSSGIGMALVERLLAEGHTVITCSWEEEKLKEVKTRNPNLHIRVCDVGIPEQREKLATWVLENFPDVNVLINNAGIQNRMNLLYQDKTWDEYEQEIRINLSGSIHLTMLFANHLAKQKNAAIINVSGGVAFTPMAATPIYSATKAGIHSFTQSLRDHFANTGVEVFEIIPPGVAGTYLGGRGLRTSGVPLDEFIDSVMNGLHGKEAEIAYDTSARVYRASRDQLDERTAEITRMFPVPVPAASTEKK